MGRTQRRILGTLRLRRLAARRALADALDGLCVDREGPTPCPVPVRADRRRRTYEP